MTYTALLQKEFFKIARTWEELSVDQQRRYVLDHPLTKKHIVVPQQLTNEGKDIAKRLHIRYNGYWPEIAKHTFTDSQTHSTVLAKTFEEAEFKLQETRELFRAKAARIHREFIRLAYSL